MRLDEYREHIVPWDVARAGDEQVAIPLLLRDGTSDRSSSFPLDTLSGELTSVESVVASSPVHATRPLPNIRELILMKVIPNPELWDFLPNLEALAVLLPPSTFDLGQLPVTLRMLALHWLPRQTQSWFDQLQGFTRLEKLTIEMYVSFSVEPIANLRRLRELVLDGGKHLSKLRKLRDLERAEFSEVKLASLDAFKGWTRLRRLLVHEVKDLSGIEGMVSLEDLALIGRKLPVDLGPLSLLPKLRRLRLSATEATRDFSHLRGLTRLEKLEISLGHIGGFGEFADIEFVRGMAALEELRLDGFVRNGNLDALLGKKIRKAYVRGSFGREADRIRALLPSGPDIRLLTLPPRAGPEPVVLEPFHMAESEPPYWHVSDDLTEAFGKEDNGEVEDVIRREIRRRSPALYPKLEFDSEASEFCVRAEAEAEIREAAAIIKQMIAERAAKRRS